MYEILFIFSLNKVHEIIFKLKYSYLKQVQVIFYACKKIKEAW